MEHVVKNWMDSSIKEGEHVQRRRLNLGRITNSICESIRLVNCCNVVWISSAHFLAWVEQYEVDLTGDPS